MDEDDDPKEELDEEFFEDANGNMQNQEPQVHHQEVDLDMSGSSMEFLRANGPDVAIDEVFEGIQSDGSSSSSDVSSPLNEDMIRFIVAQNQCATIIIFHRRGIPSIGSQSISFSPILVDSDILTSQPSQIQLNDSNSSSLIPSGLEIVP